MNPYTQSLLKGVRDPDLVEFVVRWDQLEALVIRVFKGKSASEEDEAEHEQLRTWLEAHYPRWKAAFDPYWPLALAGGRPPAEDPFALVLRAPQAAGFVKNWTAMQHLPAARQALNQYLMDLLEKE